MDNNIETGHRKTFGFDCHFSADLLSHIFWCGVLALTAFNLNAFVIGERPAMQDIGEYTSVSGNFSRSSLPYGYPDIPVVRIMNVNLSTVRINVISEETISLSKQIYPIQAPVSKTESRSLFTKDIKAYESKEPFFKYVYALLPNKTLEIYPYDYIPSKSILITREIDVYCEQEKEKAVSNKVIGIYKDIFENKIDELKDFYIKRGYDISMYPISAAGDNTADIKSFIETKYNSSEFDYLFLLGSGGNIPYFQGSGYDYPSTDLYYSLMDSFDYFPDFVLSRLPFTDTVELSSYLYNVKNEYANNKISYNDKAYFIASNDGYYHTIVESTQTYSMREMRSKGCYCDSFFGYYLTGTPIDSALKSGREMAFYSGHGSAFNWSGPTYYPSDIESLLNAPLFPIILSFACLTGNYSITDFFGYNWLKNKDSGATSFIGASSYTYWEEDDFMQRSFVDSIESTVSIAGVMNKAKMAFYQEYGNSSMTLGYFERYNYFTLPEIYSGNRDVSDFSFSTDKYQPLSAGNIKGIFHFTGTLDNPAFAGAFIKDTLIDSSYFINETDVLFNISSFEEGDTLTISCYVPGLYFEEKPVRLIKDGQFVSLSSYNLTDYRIDTFFFDLNFKNYGTTSADSSKVLITGYDDIFNLLSNDIVIYNLFPDSSVTIPDGIIFEINGYSDSIVSALCSIGTINGNDTVYEVLNLDLLKPDFNVSFKNTYSESETLDYVLLSAYSTLAFNITNFSPLKSKDIRIEINSKSFFCLDNVEIIDSLGSYEAKAFSFDVFTYSSSHSLCSLDIIVSIGNYSDTAKIILPARYGNSEMYLGPVDDYYIFTNKMTDFENSPKFKYINIDSFAFRQIEVTDDTTLSIKLPFKFNFHGESSDTVYFNTNGILSLHRIADNTYSSEPLPTLYASNPAIFAGWLDYRCEYYDDTYMKPSDAVNTCFSYFDTLNYQFIIYYNKVTAEEMPHTFAVCIDTSDITVHYYNIPDSSAMITGIQFNSSAYLSLTDSAYSEEFTPRNGMSVKITNKKPVLKNKFTQIYQKKLEKPAINSVAFLPKSSIVNISINKSGYYEILLFDASGRMIDRVYKGIILESQSNYHIESHSGVAFLIIRDDTEVLVSKKLVLF